MEKEIVEKTWTEKDLTNNGNEMISYRSLRCPFCNEEEIFMNVGEQSVEWIGITCHLKTSFGKEKIVHDLFGWHFEEI